MDKLLKGKNWYGGQETTTNWGKDYWPVGTEIPVGSKVKTAGKKSVNLGLLVVIALMFVFAFSVQVGGVTVGDSGTIPSFCYAGETTSHGFDIDSETHQVSPYANPLGNIFFDCGVTYSNMCGWAAWDPSDYSGEGGEIAATGTNVWGDVVCNSTDGYAYQNGDVVTGGMCDSDEIVCVRDPDGYYAKLYEGGDCNPCVSVDWEITATPCYDNDNDGWNSSVGPDSLCGPVRDCDDNDDHVHPPWEGMPLDSDRTLCPGHYDIDGLSYASQFPISANGVTLDCNGAILEGSVATNYMLIYDAVGYSDITIKNCHFKGYDYVLYPANAASSGWVIEDNIFDYTGNTNIYASHATDLTIKNNYFNGTSSYAQIRARYGVNGLYIRDNIFNGTGMGISLGWSTDPISQNIAIEDNIFYNMNSYRFLGAGQYTGLNLTRNKIYGGSNYPFYFGTGGTTSNIKVWQNAFISSQDVYDQTGAVSFSENGMGNYWSHESCTDTSPKDGFCDNSLTIDATSTGGTAVDADAYKGPWDLNCKIPKSGMLLEQDSYTCPGKFFLDAPLTGATLRVDNSPDLVVDLEGTEFISTGSGVGMSVKNSDNVVVSGGIFTGFDTGFVIDPTYNGTVCNITVSDGNIGLLVDNVTNSTFCNITAFNNTYGIYVNKSDNNTFNISNIYNNTNGIWSHYFSDNNTYHDNLFYDNGMGLEFYVASKDNLVYHNNFSDNRNAHAHVSSGGSNNQFNITGPTGPEGNWYSDIEQNSLGIWDGNNDGYGDLGENYPYGSAKGGNISGIYGVDYGPQPVRGNCYDTDGDGSYNTSSDSICPPYRDCADNDDTIIAPSLNKEIVNNYTICSGTYQFDLDPSDYMFHANIIDGHMRCNGTVIVGNGSGMGVYSEYTFNLSDCTFKNFTYGYYMDLESCWNQVLQNNTFANSTYGFYCLSDLSAGVGNVINHSNFSSTDTGVYVDWMQSAKVTENVFEYNSKAGINLTQDSDNNDILNNTFLKNDIGIYFDPTSNNNLVVNNTFNQSTSYQAYDSSPGNTFYQTVGLDDRGNWWSDVFLSMLDIYDNTGDGYGDAGTDYPYNSANGGDVKGVIDQGPAACIDEDGDGAWAPESDPLCAGPYDCDDSDANVLPPTPGMQISSPGSYTLCPGTYDLSSSSVGIDIRASGVTLTGNDTVIIGSAGSLDPAIRIFYKWNVIIQNITIAGGNIGLQLYGTSGVNVEDSIIRNMNITDTYYGLRIDGAKDCQFYDLNISKSYYGIFSQRSSFPWVEYNNFTNITIHDGQIKLSRSYIRENRFRNIYLFPNETVGSAFFYELNSYTDYFDDFYIEAPGTGIYLYATGNKQFNNITVFGTTTPAYGVYMYANNGDTVSNSVFSGMIYGAFIYNNADNNIFYGNTFYGGTYGIRITSSSDANLFYDNNISGNSNMQAFDDVGGNHYNTTVGGEPHGNYWGDIDTLDIVDTTGDIYGDFGPDYPYSQATGGDVSANVVDYGPHVTKKCYDNDLDTFFDQFGDPSCPGPFDCDDSDPDVIPPTTGLQVDRDITLCPGTFYCNASSSTSDAIQFTTDGVTLRGKGTTIKGNASNFGYGIDTNGRDNVQIRDMDIETYSRALTLDSDTYDSIVDNVTFSNCNIGLYFTSAYDSNASNVDFTNCNTGILFSSFAQSNFIVNFSTTGGSYGIYSSVNTGQRNNISKGTITSASSYGIYFNNALYNTIKEVVIDGDSGDSNACVYLTNNAHANYFSNNTFQDCVNGVYITSGGGQSNRFWYNSFQGNTNLHANVLQSNNHFNITVGGVAHGNFWDDAYLLNILDLNADKFGDAGTQYPYSNANGGNVSTNVVDYGPIVNAAPITSDNYSLSDRDWNMGKASVNLSAIDADFSYTEYCSYNVNETICVPTTQSFTNPTIWDHGCPYNTVCQVKLRYHSVDTSANNETYKQTGQINLVNGSTIYNSSLDYTSVENGAFIIDSDLTDSHVDNCYVANSTIINSSLMYDPNAKNPCYIVNSTIIDSKINSSRIIDSHIDPTTITDSVVINSTCSDCNIIFSEIANTDFCGAFNIFAGIVVDAVFTAGRIEYSGISYYPVLSTESICSGLPSVAISNPLGGEVVNGTFNILFTTTESNDPEISFDGGAFADAGSFTTYAWDTTTVQDGAHTIQVRDQDPLGDWYYSNVVSVIVDNTPDTVLVIRPEDGDLIIGDQEVSAVAADYISQVEFTLINGTGNYRFDGNIGVETDSDGTDGWGGVWQSSLFGEGVYNLSATAYERCYFVTNCWRATDLVENLVIDRTRPTGSIEIVGSSGSTSTTVYPSVVLNLTFDDNVDVDKCRFANTAASNLLTAQWEPCSSTKAWVLVPGDGVKTVYYEIIDKAGYNQTYSDTITLYYAPDSTPPTAPTVYDGLSGEDIDWSNDNVTLRAHWSGAYEDMSMIYYKYRVLEDGSPLGGWVNVSTATSVSNSSYTLVEGRNYSFEVVAFNTFNLEASPALSDGVVIDLTRPDKPNITSSTHPLQDTAYAESTARFHYNATDIDGGGVQSGIYGYSYLLDDWPGSAPDDVVDSRAYETLAELKNDGLETVLKINDTGGLASEVSTEIAGNLAANDVLKIRIALAERIEDTVDDMTIALVVSDDAPSSYGTNPNGLLGPVQVHDMDVKYAYDMEDAKVYEFEFTVNDTNTNDNFFVTIAGMDTDTDNRQNLSIGGTAVADEVDDSTTTYHCEEGSSCEENASIEYAIGVERLNTDNETYTVQYDLLGDGTYYFHVKARDVAGNWGETQHYKIIVSAGGVSVAISEPVDGQMFFGGDELNITADVFTSDNASVSIVALHPDGSNYTSPGREVLTSLKFGNITIEKGTNEIYALANASNGVQSKSTSVYVLLSESISSPTEKTLKVSYSGCSGGTNICSATGGGVVAGVGSETGTVVGGIRADTSRHSIKIFATSPTDYDQSEVENELIQDTFLDQVQPFFGLKRGVGEYLLRNELRYDDIKLGGGFRLSPGTYSIYLRHNGVTSDGKVNVTVVLQT